MSVLPAFFIMPNIRLISKTQLEELVTWMELHPKLATGSHVATTQVKQFTHRLWKELATRLNAHSNGCNKNVKGWRQYWSDTKSKVRKKVVLGVQQASATGRPTWGDLLTPIEVRILSLVKTKAVSGIPNGHILVDRFLDESRTSVAYPKPSPPRVTLSVSPFEEPTLSSNNVSCAADEIDADDSDESLQTTPAKPIKRRYSDGTDLNSDVTAPKLTVHSAPPRPFEIEDSRLCDEEQRLSLDERWLTLDERRLTLDERRLALDERRLAIDERRLTLDKRRLALEETRFALSCRKNGEKETAQGVHVKNIEDLLVVVEIKKDDVDPLLPGEERKE